MIDDHTSPPLLFSRFMSLGDLLSVVSALRRPLMGRLHDALLLVLIIYSSWKADECLMRGSPGVSG